jgi:dihydroflavonol-4-reductase
VTTLVTGATGFLGSHLVPLLADRGDTVRALVREGTDATSLERIGVEVVRGDVLDPDAVGRAADDCALVFHLAGVLTYERRDEPRARRVNVDGVRTLLAAADPAARVVHVSSVSTIGPPASPGGAATEDSPFAPWAERLVYHPTKRDGERLALDAAASGRDVVVANPGFLIGPGDVHEVTTWLVRRYLRGELRVVIDGGLSFVDARDVASGLLTLAERGRAGERTILTNRGGNLSYEAFFKRIGELTGVRRRMVKVPASLALVSARIVPWPLPPGQLDAARHWWFYDPAKAEAELAFAPRPIDETIADTAAQYL